MTTAKNTKGQALQNLFASTDKERMGNYPHVFQTGAPHKQLSPMELQVGRQREAIMVSTEMEILKDTGFNFTF